MADLRRTLRRIKDSNPLFRYLYDDVWTGYRTSWHITPSQLVHRVFSNPQLLLLYASNLLNRSIRRRHADVMAREFDNLIVLDSCRYDLFEETVEMDGELTSVVSPGSGTGEFLSAVLGGADLRDTVYVTATPGVMHVEEHVDVRLHAVVNVWEDDWDDELATVPPEAMVRRALDAYERYPDKRLVVHFMQPHYPFIGETGRELEHRSYGQQHRGSTDNEAKSIWKQLRDGEVDRETVERAYRENLEIVLPHVEELVDGVDGRTVVTSDHGNAYGRMGVYGHTPGAYLEGLVRVPWFVASGGPRRKTVAEEPSAVDERDQAAVQERLEDLGYVDQGGF